MKLDFIDLGKLSISKANMRYAKKTPDVSDILPTVRARGVLVPLIVRPNCADGAYEIVAGARRYTAAQIVAGERGEAGTDPLPCAILDDGDDAAAIEAIDTGPKVPRPEVTSTMQTYIDLHRHAAVRAALTRHPKVALRLMVAHAIAGSHLWTVKIEEQASRNEMVRESVETCKGETEFDIKRRAVLDLLGFSPEEPTVTGGNGDGYGLVGLFLRLLDLPDRAVMDVILIVIGETLAAGSAAVEAVGSEIGVDMADYWQADDAFFECLRDKEVLTALVAEVAGEEIAAANAKEKGATLKRIVRDHLDGANGRAKVEGWVPKWMAFPPSAYTARGGVGTVAAHAKVQAARADNDPEPGGPGAVIALPAPAKAEPEQRPEREAA